MAAIKLSLGDVLTIITGYFIYPGNLINRIATLKKILSALTGIDVPENETWAAANKKCKSYLLRLSPKIASAETDFKTEILLISNYNIKDIKTRDSIIAEWLKKQISKYGDEFKMEPIPKTK